MAFPIIWVVAAGVAGLFLCSRGSEKKNDRLVPFSPKSQDVADPLGQAVEAVIAARMTRPESIRREAPERERVPTQDKLDRARRVVAEEYEIDSYAEKFAAEYAPKVVKAQRENVLERGLNLESVDPAAVDYYKNKIVNSSNTNKIYNDFINSMYISEDKRAEKGWVDPRGLYVCMLDEDYVKMWIIASYISSAKGTSKIMSEQGSAFDINAFDLQEREMYINNLNFVILPVQPEMLNAMDWQGEEEEE